MKKTNSTTEPCPCGGKTYATCCAPYHQGASAPTAEALMRSRYTAFVYQMEPYLLTTWHPDTRPETLDLAGDNAKWLGLEVKRHVQDGPDSALVEFVARYKVNGRAHRLHEISRFTRDAEGWRYVDGTFPEADSV